MKTLSTQQPGLNPAMPMQTAKKLELKNRFFQFSFKDLLTALFSAVLPIAIGIHTTIVTREESIRANELRQQFIFDQFLDNIYRLHLDNELNDSAEPWAFANARYRSAHRQWDLERKQQSIQFLKEKHLIGRHSFNVRNGSIEIGCRPDIIRLKQLNFNKLNVESSAKDVFKLNMTCIHFEQISMDGVRLSDVDLSYALFDRVRLNNAVFDNTSLANAIFSNCNLDGADFGDSDMSGVIFIDVDLSKVKLRPSQLSQATFYNVTMPNGSYVEQSKGAPVIHHQGLVPIKTTVNPTTVPNFVTMNLCNFQTSFATVPEEMGTTKSTSFVTQQTTSSSITTEYQNVHFQLPNIPENSRWLQTSDTLIFGLKKASGLAIDPDDGTVYVADSGNSRIVSWSPIDGKTANVLTNLDFPTNILIEKVTNSLIIADNGAREVLQWFFNGKLRIPATIIANIECYGLAMDREGSLYVSDTKSHQVRKYSNLRDKVGIVVAGGNGQGSNLNQLDEPRYITVDADGTLYITDYNNNRIVKWPKYSSIGILVTSGDQRNKDSGLGPNGLVVDTNGNIYVAENFNHRISLWQKHEATRIILVGGYQSIFEAKMKLSLSKETQPDVMETSTDNRIPIEENSENQHDQSEEYLGFEENEWNHVSEMDSITVSDTDAYAEEQLSTISESPVDEELAGQQLNIENPHGLAFDPHNNMYVIDGESGVLKTFLIENNERNV